MKRLFMALLMLLIAAGVAAGADDLDRAQALYDKGQFEEATAILKPYVETHTEPRANFLLAYSLYKLGRFDEANTYFQKAYTEKHDFSPTPSIEKKLNAPYGPARPGWTPPVTKTVTNKPLRTKVKTKTKAAAKQPAKSSAPAPAPVEKPAVTDNIFAPDKPAAPTAPVVANTAAKPAAPAASNTASAVAPAKPARPVTPPTPPPQPKGLLDTVMEDPMIMYSVIGVLALYVIIAIVAFILGRKRGVGGVWMAFIPVAQFIVLIKALRGGGGAKKSKAKPAKAPKDLDIELPELPEDEFTAPAAGEEAKDDFDLDSFK